MALSSIASSPTEAGPDAAGRPGSFSAAATWRPPFHPVPPLSEAAPAKAGGSDSSVAPPSPTQSLASPFALQQQQSVDQIAVQQRGPSCTSTHSALSPPSFTGASSAVGLLIHEQAADERRQAASETAEEEHPSPLRSFLNLFSRASPDSSTDAAAGSKASSCLGSGPSVAATSQASDAVVALEGLRLGRPRNSTAHGVAAVSRPASLDVDQFASWGSWKTATATPSPGRSLENRTSSLRSSVDMLGSSASGPQALGTLGSSRSGGHAWGIQQSPGRLSTEAAGARAAALAEQHIEGFLREESSKRELDTAGMRN